MLATEPLQCGTWLFFGRTRGSNFSYALRKFENMNSFIHTYILTYIQKVIIELSYVSGIAEYHQTKETSPVFNEKVSYVPF